MIKESNLEFTSPIFRPLRECKPLLSKILEYDVTQVDDKYLHAVLKKCAWLQKKPITYTRPNGKQKPSCLYHIGHLKRVLKDPFLYDDSITELGLEFQNITNIKLPWLNRQVTFPNVTAPTEPKSKKESHDEIFPDESNMEYCNQQLLNKYMTDSICRTIKLTESQFNRLINILS